MLQNEIRQVLVVCSHNQDFLILEVPFRALCPDEFRGARYSQARELVMKVLRGTWNNCALNDRRETIRQSLQDGFDNASVAAARLIVRGSGHGDIRSITVIRDVCQLRTEIGVMNENLVMPLESLLNRLANGSKPDNANPQIDTRFPLQGRPYGSVETSLGLYHSIQDLQKAP